MVSVSDVEAIGSISLRSLGHSFPNEVLKRLPEAATLILSSCRPQPRDFILPTTVLDERFRFSRTILKTLSSRVPLIDLFHVKGFFDI